MLPLVGMKLTPLRAILDPSGSGTEARIFWMIRVPRVLAGWLAGAALAAAGMAYQALFRNSLATPFTLGVASGAALGAALSIRFGLYLSVAGFSGTPLWAFAGASASILLVYGITRARRGMSTATMLLAGVAVSFFFSSLNLFTQYISDFTHTFRIIRWLMGGVQVAGFRSVLEMAPLVLAGLLITLRLTRELDILATGEEMAAGRGVDVVRTRNMLFFASSLMVGGVVAVCGPIGFVGLMIPHICRLLVGPGHRVLAPASILAGGSFLALCDTFARTIIAPAEIPVGVITALLGGPFFLALLIREGKH
ncbi:MAG: iron ABC transporter permease [bacterium]|nr:MAG: iron ABC transporter permease [bacterium]